MSQLRVAGVEEKARVCEADCAWEQRALRAELRPEMLSAYGSIWNRKDRRTACSGSEGGEDGGRCAGLHMHRRHRERVVRVSQTAEIALSKSPPLFPTQLVALRDSMLLYREAGLAAEELKFVDYVSTALRRHTFALRRVLP